MLSHLSLLTEHSNLRVSDDTAEGMNIIVLGAAITACEAKWEAALQLFGALAAGDEFSQRLAARSILLDALVWFVSDLLYVFVHIRTLNSVNSYTILYITCTQPSAQST